MNSDGTIGTPEQQEEIAKIDPALARYSVWCAECEVWLSKQRSHNKAWKVAKQHMDITKHELEVMISEGAA